MPHLAAHLDLPLQLFLVVAVLLVALLPFLFLSAQVLLKLSLHGAIELLVGTLLSALHSPVLLDLLILPLLDLHLLSTTFCQSLSRVAEIILAITALKDLGTTVLRLLS